MAKFRLERIESLITGIISEMILREEIRDPRVKSLVSVSSVKVSKDLSRAVVLVSGYLQADQLTAAVAGLNHAAGFIQGRIGRQLNLRTTPRLAFREDHSIKDGFEVIQQLKDLDV
jgi:ribosome-binding factor A